MSKLFSVDPLLGNETYKRLYSDAKFEEYREHCQKLWGKFKSYADKDFQLEFAKNTHPRYWEMYLGVQLLNLGFNLQEKAKRIGPDLHIIHKGRNLWIEATAPDEGIGPDAVPTLKEHNRFTPVPEDKIILRFTNAVSEKLKSYIKYLENGIVSPLDYYLIAINGHGIGMLMFDNPLRTIIKSLYPIGDEVWNIDFNKMEVVSEYYKTRLNIIKKSGALVNTHTFMDPKYSGVSGVLYSDAALFNQHQTPGEEFLYIQNLVADSKLDSGWLGIGTECFVRDDELFMKKIM